MLMQQENLRLGGVRTRSQPTLGGVVWDINKFLAFHTSPLVFFTTLWPDRGLIFSAEVLAWLGCTPRCTPRSCASFSSAHGQMSHALLEQTKSCSRRTSSESTCQQGELICKNIKQISIFLDFPSKIDNVPAAAYSAHPRNISVNISSHGQPFSAIQRFEIYSVTGLATKS